MSHTPGPWYFESNQSTGAFDICADGHGAIGGVLVLASRKEHPRKRHEMLSNASLIAAAPDLLEALQAATRCLAWHEERHGVGMDKKAVETARAAILKATEGMK